MTYAEKLKDPRWQKKRLEVLSSDDFTCQYCGEKEKTLHVHHYVYSKSRNPWDANDGDLITLCEDCHTMTHQKDIPLSAIELYSTIVFYAQCNMDARSLLRNINQTILKFGK